MPKPFDQAAAVPVRGGLVGLITSSNRRRWVVPKGQIDPGHTAPEAAAIEAWEEAGWLGRLDDEPIGSFSYRKLGRERHVLVFLLTVTEEKDEWPEATFRTREWLTAEVAAARVEEPELRAILLGLASRVNAPSTGAV